jgi:hypothetical protein
MNLGNLPRIKDAVGHPTVCGTYIERKNQLAR